MPRWAIGDVQGCHDELNALLRQLRFSADRDQLLFVGDLVNRGPGSLAVLRQVRSLGDNALVVLGNHDLHLLAHCVDRARPLRKGDTLQPVLDAPDCTLLADWLIQQPLLRHDPLRRELLVHAGLIPQWSAAEAARLAAEVSTALQQDPAGFLGRMYGNEPDRWRDDLPRDDRLRFTLNVLTRLRYCSAEGRLNLKLKCAPAQAPAPWQPWFAHDGRQAADTRIVFGHWSTLGWHRSPGLLGLDTGCVWGGCLTAVNLDEPDAPPVALGCRAWQATGAD